jgi:hypothetical protein
VHNLYSDTAFYFINVDGGLAGGVSGTAKRMAVGNAAYVSATAGLRVNSFIDNWVYEKDNINLLSSGKLWLGDVFSNALGGVASRNYSIDMPGIVSSDSVTLKIYAAARSIGVPANFAVRVNNNLVQNIVLPAVSGGFLDTYASYVSAITKVAVGSNPLQLNLLFSTGAGNISAEGFLDKIECAATRALALNTSSALFFRSAPVNASTSAATAAFVVSGAGVTNFANTTVLDVTDITAPKKWKEILVQVLCPNLFLTTVLTLAGSMLLLHLHRY